MYKFNSLISILGKILFLINDELAIRLFMILKVGDKSYNCFIVCFTINGNASTTTGDGLLVVTPILKFVPPPAVIFNSFNSKFLNQTVLTSESISQYHAHVQIIKFKKQTVFLNCSVHNIKIYVISLVLIIQDVLLSFLLIESFYPCLLASSHQSNIHLKHD